MKRKKKTAVRKHKQQRKTERKAASRPRTELQLTNMIKYSPTEIALFNLLPQNGSKIDTKTLTRLYYKKSIPLHGRVIVNGTVQQLIEKVRRNKEPFTIYHSGRAGPNSAEVWVEY